MNRRNFLRLNIGAIGAAAAIPLARRVNTDPPAKEQEQEQSKTVGHKLALSSKPCLCSGLETATNIEEGAFPGWTVSFQANDVWTGPAIKSRGWVEVPALFEVLQLARERRKQGLPELTDDELKDFLERRITPELLAKAITDPLIESMKEKLQKIDVTAFKK